METTPRSELTIPEQIAIIETLGDIPVEHVLAGTVTARPHTEGTVLIEWDGVAIIPTLQLESVLRVVAAEQEAREAADS